MVVVRTDGREAEVRETLRVTLDDGLFVAVLVAADVRAMRRLMAATTGFHHPEQLACAWETRGTGEWERCVALLFLPRTRIGVGLVAHEMAHVAFRVAERRGLKVTHWRGRTRNRTVADQAGSPEEAYANIIEQLCRGFWAEAYARKVVR